ncbi:MtrAB system accessory lipoprotein LpqB [Gordonia paraffinivorans]|uniref:MtrAB system accessory lipoprotein LpqB n=1 Tax=Gordonia paraffinivorans TaxID=175628 RepID=UPI00242EE6CC|nr:MtrAB system accessory lipoprotein LpqB [Gordonia paraffinivorans]
MSGNRRPVRARGGARGIVAAVATIIAALLVVSGCGSIPDDSSPQPIKSFQREAATNAAPAPQADMDPEALVRAFLKSTVDPDAGHDAARAFLTPVASQQWDDRGDALILDEISIFVDQRDEDSVRMRLIGDNVGTLKSDGQLLPASGRVETTLSLTRQGDQWRIDGPLPNGTMIDRDQFANTYRPVSLYFSDRTGRHLVPDPRWFYAGQATDPTALVNRLIAGPATDLAAAVDSGFPSGATLRGPVVGLPEGGVRIDLSGIGNASNRNRTVLAAQLVWTLDGADISGPYVIDADGAPLSAERASGWQPADVRSFDPDAVPSTDVGLNIVTGGALRAVTENAAVPVRGPLGTSRDVRAATISENGDRVAAVRAVGGSDRRLECVIGDYGGNVGPIAEGASITRPSFGSDENTVWVVVDGRPLQWQRDDDGTRTVPVEASSIPTVARGAITEMQIAPDGVRAALVVGGQVVFAILSTNAEGQVSLTSPRIAAFNIGNRAVSLDWASPTTLVIAREAPESPVVQLSIDGTPAVGLLSGNVSPPVRAVVANSSTIYVGDQRGVLRLGSDDGQPDQYWTEVEPAMIPGAIPVLP